MQLPAYPLLIAKEKLRRSLRVMLAFMGFCGGLAIAAFTPPHGWEGWLSPLFVGVAYGVPAGLVLYLVYRLLRFALGR